MSVNPFKYIYEVRTSRPNPFTILGATTDMNQAGIESQANARDRAVKAGLQPDPNFELQIGDCITAAQLLRDPVLRLAFEFMLQGSELFEVCNEEEVNRD